MFNTRVVKEQQEATRHNLVRLLNNDFVPYERYGEVARKVDSLARDNDRLRVKIKGLEEQLDGLIAYLHLEYSPNSFTRGHSTQELRRIKRFRNWLCRVMGVCVK